MKDLKERRVCVKLCFKIEKQNFYGGFSDVTTGLWRGLFEPYAISPMVPAFQIGQNVHRRRTQIWRPSMSMDDDHVDKVLAVIRQNRRLTVREVA